MRAITSRHLVQTCVKNRNLTATASASGATPPAKSTPASTVQPDRDPNLPRLLLVGGSSDLGFRSMGQHIHMSTSRDLFESDRSCPSFQRTPYQLDRGGGSWWRGDFTRIPLFSMHFAWEGGLSQLLLAQVTHMMTPPYCALGCLSRRPSPHHDSNQRAGLDDWVVLCTAVFQYRKST